MKKTSLITGITGKDGSYLIGDLSKAYNNLSWVLSISLEGLVTDMINHDIEFAHNESLLLKKVFNSKRSREF